MTDQTSNGAAPNGQNGGGNGQDGGMEINGALPITVNAQYVKDLSFENPNAPHTLTAGQAQPSIDLQVDVQARGIGENVSEVVLNIRAQASQPDRAVFIAELAYAGVFTLPPLPMEQARALLLIEAPRLLFPFARQIIADVVRDGGYPPLMLQPLDFVDLYRRQVMGEGGEAPLAQA
jgi:preprotein translocase subunit SecB